MKSRGPHTIQSEIGSGLPITFKPGAIFGFIDNPGNGEVWNILADRGPIPEECTGLSYQWPQSAGDGPQQMAIDRCVGSNLPFTNDPEGISGGPWINSANGLFDGIGAVSSQANGNQPVIGTYLGGCAEWLFDTVQSSKSYTRIIQPIGDTC